MNPHYQQQLHLRPSFIVFFSLSHKPPTFAFTSESGYTLGFAQRIAHNGSHAKAGAFPSWTQRGFVGGPRALATAALYLVLKSNGLRHSKNPSVKFSFSLKIVPATIAKKLPPQRCFKPLLIPLFNFSHKRPTFAFTGESGYTLGLRRKIAHNGTHAETEAFPPPVTARLCAASEISFIPPRFYIHTFPGSL